MRITVRGYTIYCNAKNEAQAVAYRKLYEEMTDERLAELSRETTRGLPHAAHDVDV